MGEFAARQGDPFRAGRVIGDRQYVFDILAAQYAALFRRQGRGHVDRRAIDIGVGVVDGRSEEHTSELQSLMRISYAVFCLKKKILNVKLHFSKLLLILTSVDKHTSRRNIHTSTLPSIKHRT